METLVGECEQREILVCVDTVSGMSVDRSTDVNRSVSVNKVKYLWMPIGELE